MLAFYDVLDFFAYLLRFSGSVLFGVGSAWLALHLVKGEHSNWQLSAAALLGLLAAFVLIGHWVAGAATLGGFGLGAGGGLLAWGLGAAAPQPTRDQARARKTTRRTSSR